MYSERVLKDPTFQGVYQRSLIRTLYYNQNKVEEKRLRICWDFFKTIPVTIYVRKEFFLLKAINTKIEALKAAGLIDLWNLQDIDKRLFNIRPSKHPKVLSFHLILCCFEVLGIGCLLSIITFLVELLLGKFF